MFQVQVSNSTIIKKNDALCTKVYNNVRIQLFLIKKTHVTVQCYNWNTSTPLVPGLTVQPEF